MTNIVFNYPAKFGNRQSRSVKAGRRPATTGVAALVASLAILVAPIDGARANPPTSNVIVINPATNPALTRSVDDPGRIAYQSTAAKCSLNQTTCSFSFPAVPQDHRLVVEHVSGFLSFNGSASGANVFLSGGANEARSSFFAPTGIQDPSSGSILFDQPVLQYFDAGSAPVVATFTEVSLQANGSTATVSGYLLDCATTPCEPIAQ